MPFKNIARQSRIAVVCLGILSAAPLSAVAEAAGSFGKWAVQASEDPMTDQKIVTMSLAADGKDASNPNAVILMLTCSKENGAVGIAWEHQFLGGEDNSYGRYKEITFRADKSAPFAEDWRVLDDGTTARADDAAGFIKKVRNGSRLVAKVAPYQEQPITVVFETTGLLEALMSARPECDWFIRDVLWEQYQQKLKAEAAKSGFSK